jgi:hypothetical protein
MQLIDKNIFIGQDKITLRETALRLDRFCKPALSKAGSLGIPARSSYE